MVTAEARVSACQSAWSCCLFSGHACPRARHSLSMQMGVEVSADAGVGSQHQGALTSPGGRYSGEETLPTILPALTRVRYHTDHAYHDAHDGTPNCVRNSTAFGVEPLHAALFLSCAVVYATLKRC